jgi:hypothetical protein
MHQRLTLDLRNHGNLLIISGWGHGASLVKLPRSLLRTLLPVSKLMVPTMTSSVLPSNLNPFGSDDPSFPFNLLYLPVPPAQSG